MSAYRHGLLIGKFYPPHLGHHAAIRYAAERCGQVTVLVMASMRESIPLADRVAWLTAEHSVDPAVRVLGVPCDVPLDLGDAAVWEAQVAVMTAALRVGGPARPAGGAAGSAPPVAARAGALTGRSARATGAVPAAGRGGAGGSAVSVPVDAVFAAEDYGAELARRFGAEFVRVPRAAGAPSGTAYRADPAGAWSLLAPATRAGLAVRVVVIGAESTGTTTVTRALAEHYKAGGGEWAATQWVPEYGREYTEDKWDQARKDARGRGEPEPGVNDLVWVPEDFDRIGVAQTAIEQAAARTGSPLLLCDTDAFATAVWERRYLGADARADQPWAHPPALPRRDVYLLTDHVGVPWQDDGLREGDLSVRAAMTGWFADAMTAAGHSWVLLTGSVEQRVRLAIRTIDPILATRLRLAPPAGGPGFDR
jgi:HTH-type transcriptional regulator, transcriptional repressor of NAD biosynthesis genes